MKMKLTIAAGFIVFLCTFYSCSNEVNCPSENLEQSDSSEGSRSFQSTDKLRSYIHRYVDDYIKTVPANNYGVSGYYVEMTGEGKVGRHISTDEAMG